MCRIIQPCRLSTNEIVIEIMLHWLLEKMARNTQITDLCRQMDQLVINLLLSFLTEVAMFQTKTNLTETDKQLPLMSTCKYIDKNAFKIFLAQQSKLF